MTLEQIYTVIILCAFTIPMIIMSIILMRGRGAFLMAGYNTMPREKRAQYDKVALCKFTGKMAMIINFCATGFIIASLFFNIILMWAFGAGFAVTLLFTIIYANTKNRFKIKPEQQF